MTMIGSQYYGWTNFDDVSISIMMSLLRIMTTIMMPMIMINYYDDDQ